MKRHIQKTGVRKFFGQDLIDLQSEPLKALDSFFAQYGSCIINGCEIEPQENDTFNIASGLVAIEATDPETNITAIKVMPFGGAEAVALPLYLTAQSTIVERVYGDAKVKPIAYDFQAVAVGVEPQTPFIKITAEGNNRFVDVLQDDKHSFITATERNKWNAILQAAKDYTDSVSSTKVEATLRSAKEYTDGEIAGVQNEMEVANADTLRTAKDYADMIVAALVDNTPEALNTLQELAAALGDNPNFATDVLQAIGERATMAQVNAALSGKADANHSHSGYADKNGSGANDFHVKNLRIPFGTAIIESTYNKTLLGQGWAEGVGDYFTIGTPGAGVQRVLRGGSGGSLTWGGEELYHSGNDAMLYKHYADGVGNLNDLTTVGSYSYGPDTHNRPSPYGVVNVISNNIGWVSQTAYQTETTNVFYRQKTNDGAWSSWQLLYHSGNMGDYRKVILSGRVSAEGVKVMGKGDWLVRRMDEGIYEVFYNLPHSNYIPIVTGMNGMWACSTGITSTILGVKTGDDSSPNNGAFSFVLLEI